MKINLFNRIQSIILWILKKDYITIADAKTKVSGTKIKVCGIVTSDNGVIFLQDNTGGIELYKQKSGEDFQEGDLIKVGGTLKNRKGRIRIRRFIIKKLSTNNQLPNPVEISLSKISFKNKNNTLNKLVKVKNVRLQKNSWSSGSRIDDNFGNKFYLSAIELEDIEDGDIVDITGIIFFNKKYYELYVRKVEDVIKINKAIILDFYPGNMTTSFNTTPVIGALVKSGSSFLNTLTAKLLVDGVEEKIEINRNSIMLKNNKELSFGQHFSEIFILDDKKNQYRFKWNFKVEKKNLKYNFYYGIPHAHTSYSDGEGTPIVAIEKAKDNGLDFMFVTDHSGSINRSIYYSDEKIILNGEKNSKWKMVNIQVEEMNKKYDDFLALVGFETNSGVWGHVNIINSSKVIRKRVRKRLNTFYQWICSENNIVMSINHPGRKSSNIIFDSEFDEFINLIEVGNGSPPRKYQRYEEEYYNVLDAGWHVGAINGQDNHRANWGEVDNLTVIIAENLKKDSIMEALKARRVYSTETRSLRLSVTGNGYWMGSSIHLEFGEELNLNILAEDDKVPIEKIQIISNNGMVLEAKEFQCSKRAEWNISFLPKEENSWYIVKVIQCGNKFGISSPIFANIVNELSLIL